METAGALRSYFDDLFASSGEALTGSLKAWRGGVTYETEFWAEWFATKGLNWPDDYATRLSRRPLAEMPTALLPRRAAKPRILDVGAGPISNGGAFVSGRDSEIVAVDPLAKTYARILAANGVTPPVETRFAFAEDLSTRLDLGSFDLVTCTNALDHAIEPMWGILEMLLVAKPGAAIYLVHRRNEAEGESYAGFHQWNFDLTDGRFVIWNRSRTIDVPSILSACATVHTELTSDILAVLIRKTRELPIDPLLYQRRIRAALLEALLDIDEPGTPR